MVPKANIPQGIELLTANPDHSMLHPQNVVILAINGLARLEQWRRQSAETAGVALDGFNERIATAEARRRVQMTAWDELHRLEREALFDPSREPELWARQTAYHRQRARDYDHSISDLEQRRPLFTGVRRSILAGRQTGHLRKAQKAAGKLLA